MKYGILNPVHVYVKFQEYRSFLCVNMEEKVWILVKKKKYGLPKADRATKTLP
jgi:hypothetical protein